MNESEVRGTLSTRQDAYGHQLYDYLRGRSPGLEIVERNDGFIQPNFGPRTYLSTYRDWAPHERNAMRHVKGRVLDIGCGGGRHSLFLQKKGFQVLGVDQSPLAVKVSKTRGLKNVRVMSITQLTPQTRQVRHHTHDGKWLRTLQQPSTSKNPPQKVRQNDKSKREDHR